MSIAWTRRHSWGAVIVLVLAFVIYGQMLPIGAINWDDDSNIFKNPYYINGQWGPYWLHPYFGLFVPVTSTVWHVLYVLGGGAAWPYRILNLTLHLTNCVLLLAMLLYVCKKWDLKNSWAAILGLAVFALHPMQVQAVAWLSGARDLLSALFALLSIISFFSLPRMSGAALATIFFTASVLSKPNTVVLAALLPVLSYFFARERLRLSVVVGAGWFAITGVSVYMTLAAQKDYLTPLHWWQRVLVLGDTYSFYIQKFLFPYPLSANYDRRPEILLQGWEPVLRSMGMLLLVFPVIYGLIKKDRRLVLPVLAWFALLLPVSGLVPFGYQKVSTTADHYHYLPMAAMAIGLMFMPRMGIIVVGGLTMVLLSLSFARASVWKSDAAFFADMARYTPESYSTGMGMSVLKCKGEKDYQSGIKWIQISLRERPGEIMALSNLAYCYFNAKDYANAVALLDLLDGMDIAEMEAKQPSAFSSFLASVGSALYEVGRWREGYQLICHAYRIKPDGENNKYNLETAARLMHEKGLDTTCKYPFDWR